MKLYYYGIGGTTAKRKELYIMGLVLIPILGPILAPLTPFVTLYVALVSFFQPIADVANDWIAYFGL